MVKSRQGWHALSPSEGRGWQFPTPFVPQGVPPKLHNLLFYRLQPVTSASAPSWSSALTLGAGVDFGAGLEAGVVALPVEASAPAALLLDQLQTSSSVPSSPSGPHDQISG